MTNDKSPASAGLNLYRFKQEKWQDPSPIKVKLTLL